MSTKEIRVAITGIGNCTSHVIQGLYYYKDVADNSKPISGLMHPVLGGYKIFDVKPVAAFDIDRNKVGKDIAEAIFTKPNNAAVFAKVPNLGVKVNMGPVLDGAPDHLRQFFNVYDEMKPSDVVKVLKDSGAEIFVNFIPTGSAKAARFYADCALEAGCGYINCMPELIASDEAYQKKFKEKTLPIIGDDVKSQVGATILHRALVDLCEKRGVKVNKTSQLNFAGNTDFINLVKRGETKEMTKATSVRSVLSNKDAEVSVGFGYIGLQKDNKICRLYVEGENFGGNPITILCECSIEDSANSAGVVIDAIRYMKLAIDRKIGGALIAPSSFLMKHPPVKLSDEQAREDCEKFIQGGA
ncbi:MAG: inositol-3-phosphate synthase [Actinobacteria bacterium]|nr:inositol-3-phosphate synthase [Actinomycetota bacterium]